jgi:hypothetical protein
MMRDKIETDRLFIFDSVCRPFAAPRGKITRALIRWPKKPAWARPAAGQKNLPFVRVSRPALPSGAERFGFVRRRPGPFFGCAFGPAAKQSACLAALARGGRGGGQIVRRGARRAAGLLTNLSKNCGNVAVVSVCQRKKYAPGASSRRSPALGGWPPAPARSPGILAPLKSKTNSFLP